MKEQLEAIRAGALAAIGAAGNTGELEALRVQYLGKKGELTAVLKQMGKLSAEERPVMGQLANAVRADVESAIEQQSAVLAEKALEERLEAEALDITVPGKAHKLGHKHPMYTALDEIKEILISMGFTVLDGPEVELATYNFDKLNAGEGHPSRDWSDTFYFDEDSRVMLRSQTSPMQVRAMETMELPIRIIAPGRVYRKDEVDATHSPIVPPSATPRRCWIWNTRRTAGNSLPLFPPTGWTWRRRRCSSSPMIWIPSCVMTPVTSTPGPT